jgi:hypothetical protein
MASSWKQTKHFHAVPEEPLKQEWFRDGLPDRTACNLWSSRMSSLPHRMQAAFGSIKDYRERRRLDRALAAMEVALLAGTEAGWPEVYGEAVARGRDHIRNG